MARSDEDWLLDPRLNDDTDQVIPCSPRRFRSKPERQSSYGTAILCIVITSVTMLVGICAWKFVFNNQTATIYQLKYSAHNDNLVENSIGFWHESALAWYASLPDETPIYPFIAQLLGVQPPQEMNVWPHLKQTHNIKHWLPLPDQLLIEQFPSQSLINQSSPAQSPYLQFLVNRTILYLSDSIDRYLLEWLCGLGPTSKAGQPDDWLPAQSTLNVTQDLFPFEANDPQHGLRVCNMAALNLSLLHAMCEGIDGDQKAIYQPKNIINNVLPRHFGNATIKLAPRLDYMQHHLVPDVVVVHSCAWDVIGRVGPTLHWDQPDRLAFNHWMKRFETDMLIPALVKFSPSYRTWQTAFIKEESATSGLNVGEVADRFFSFKASTNASNTLLDVSPTPHSHPLQVNVNSNTSAEPMFMLRTCTPSHDSIDLQHRRAAQSRINRAMRHLARHYNIRILDTYTMFNGRQHGIPGAMRDAWHWSFKPLYQSFNIMLNMLRQHQLLQAL